MRTEAVPREPAADHVPDEAEPMLRFRYSTNLPVTCGFSHVNGAAGLEEIGRFAGGAA